MKWALHGPALLAQGDGTPITLVKDSVAVDRCRASLALQTSEYSGTSGSLRTFHVPLILKVEAVA